MNELYSFHDIEERWQAEWERQAVFQCHERVDRPKFYCLEMFPYPSGKLHMGHVRNYAIGDAIARFKLMNGYSVMHPMGWDAFGLPAENAAIERNVHPATWTMANIDAMRKQFKRLGYAFDWSREVATCHPEYYRWCQWLFLKMLEKGIACRKRTEVNWCGTCRTVLANEQVESGNVCWRCGQTVENREMDGWFLKITDYAEELLNDHALLEGHWPERVLTMQKNWIGRSEGAYVDFPLVGKDGKIRVFTTRPDTLYGATFMVLAPENPLVMTLADSEERCAMLRAFAEKSRQTDVIERTATGIPKEGCFTGTYAVNPLTGEDIPIWVSDFVLWGYGTGAIMSVPAHDQRDFEFARKYALPIRIVIAPEGCDLDSESMESAFEAVGKMINSGPFTGMSSDAGIGAITRYIEEKGIGCRAVTYRLRDWGISRQRYWGTPIPIVHCERCGMVPVPEDQLPVRLPDNIDFDWSLGGNPLSRVESFVSTRCPICGGPARRETDTMDTFIDSSWYYSRYCDPRNTREIVDPDKNNYWIPVDQYIGGIEHAVMHLLYARFIHKVMRDLGYGRSPEPFARLLTQGMVCLEVMRCPRDGYLYPEDVIDNGDGSYTCRICNGPVIAGRSEKMSKSKRNTRDPNDYIDRFGADTIRMFSLFAAPPQKDLDWSDSGVEGVFRFLKRIWRFVFDHRGLLEGLASGPIAAEDFGNDHAGAEVIHRKTHQTIKRVTEDFDGRYHFNTSISACMEIVNLLYSTPIPEEGAADYQPIRCAVREAVYALLHMLNPFAPHMMEELWHELGGTSLLAQGPWVTWDDAIAAEQSIEMPVQINGKIRVRLTVSADATPEELETRVRQDETVARWVEGKTIRQVIVVPQRLINVVIK
ncbi:leucine--tRNA ligase [bacterium]|nr:leucine--tRNA ligase [candidate division CSSED10-310 bacterium]